MKMKKYISYIGAVIVLLHVFSSSCDDGVWQECFDPTDQQKLCQAVSNANNADEQLIIANSIADLLQFNNGSLLNTLSIIDVLTKNTITVELVTLGLQSIIDAKTNQLIASTSENIILNTHITSLVDVIENLQTGTVIPIEMEINSKLDVLNSVIDEIDLTLFPGCSPISITTAQTISAPGNYQLCNNITGNITIAANDVQLSMNGYKITNVGGSALTISGSRIAVFNGYVTGATGVTLNSGSSLIRLTDVEARSCTATGFSGSTVSNVTLENCSADTALQGVALTNSSLCNILNCDFANSTTAVVFANSSNNRIENCSLTQPTQCGCFLSGSSRNVFNGVNIFNAGNNLVTGSVYGFISQNGSGNIFDACKVQGIQTGDLNDGIVAAGFVFTGTESCSKIINSICTNATTPTSGQSVPYGIYIIPTLSTLSTVTQATFGSTTTGTTVDALSWSPDGRFLAVAGARSGNGTTNAFTTLQLFQFDSTTNSLILRASKDHGGTVRSVAWSADQQFIAIGGDRAVSSDVCSQLPTTVRVYRFDPYATDLTEVDRADTGGTVFGVSWSTSGQFLAAVGSVVGIVSITVYNFNPYLYQLSAGTTANHGATVRSVMWSADDAFLAIAGDVAVPAGSRTHRVYAFTPSPVTLTLGLSASANWGATLNAIAWAQEDADDCYLLVGGVSSGGVTHGIYKFTKSTQVLMSPALATANAGTTINTVSWANNFIYFAVGGASGANSIYSFNRTTNVLSSLVTTTYGAAVNAVAWSPDGRLLAVGGNAPANNQEIVIESALTFPSNNLITNNTVSCINGALSACPRGAGISGSSTANLIYNNNAYNCLMPYQFVPNQFNGTSDGSPSTLQNVYFPSNVPIADQSNPLANAQQAETIIGSTAFNSSINNMVFYSSRIDNITNGAYVDAQTMFSKSIIVNSLIDLIAPLSPCAAITVTSAGTISTSGVYCLSNNITGSLVLNANDIVLDLNGHEIQNDAFGVVVSATRSWITIKNGIITTETADGILINSGCVGITISDITARQCINGINIQNAHHITIQGCDCSYNTTGIQIVNSYKVVTDSCRFFNNKSAGMSLVTSGTNVITNCFALSTGVASSFNSASTGNTYGFVSQNGVGNIFSNCIADGTFSTTTDATQLVAGFAFTGTEMCSEIVNCESGNSSSSSTTRSVTGGTVGIAPTSAGIALPYTLNNSMRLVGTAAQGTFAQGINWSPDQKYVATAGFVQSGANIQIFGFDATQTNALTPLVGTAIQSVGTLGFYAAWSPNGLYFACCGDTNPDGFNIQVFNFNPTKPNAISQRIGFGLQSLKPPAPDARCFALSWSPDGNYLATCGYATVSNDQVQVFAFNPVNTTNAIVTRVGNVSPDSTVSAYVSFSPNGKYIATLASVGNIVKIYRFDPSLANAISTQVATISGIGSINGFAWSVDGTYLVTVGAVINVYLFDSKVGTVIGPVSTVTPSSTGIMVAWSPDTKYVAVALLNGTVTVYSFNPASASLTSVFSASQGTLAIQPVWSPDGQYIVTCGNPQNGFTAQVFSVLAFPSNNIIKDNIVWCDSVVTSSVPYGVGISGSNVVNAIMSNLSYANDTNYQFVTIPFTQLIDGNGMPSPVQNVSAGAQEPIANPNNIYQSLVCLRDLYNGMNSKLDIILTKTLNGH